MKVFILVLLTSMLFAIALFHNQGLCASLDFSCTMNTSSLENRYKLVFREGNKIVAQRVYEKGKILVKEGEIPRIIDNIVIVEMFPPGQSKDFPNGRVVYSLNGKVIAKTIQKSGKIVLKGKIPDGLVIEKYPNGSIRNIICYLNGTGNGPALGLYPNGNMKVATLYENGYPVGLGRRYYENGNIMAEWEMINRKEKYHKEYYENGQLKEESYYDYEGNVLIRKEYDNKGRLIRGN